MVLSPHIKAKIYKHRKTSLLYPENKGMSIKILRRIRFRDPEKDSLSRAAGHQFGSRDPSRSPESGPSGSIAVSGPSMI